MSFSRARLVCRGTPAGSSGQRDASLPKKTSSPQPRGADPTSTSCSVPQHRVPPDTPGPPVAVKSPRLTLSLSPGLFN